MMTRSTAALALLLCIPTLGAAQSKESAWNRCKSEANFRVVVDGCTEVLRSEKDKRRRSGALVSRGDAYVQGSDDGDQGRALADFNEAIRLDPKSSVAFQSRAQLYLHKDDAERGFADFKAAIRLDPKNVALLTARAYAYHEKKNWDGAIADHTAVLRVKPRDTDALELRAVAAVQKGDFDRAITDYTEVMRVEPSKDATNVRWNRGNAYLQKGDLERAISDFSENIRVEPRHGLSYGSRAEAYERKGDLNKALGDIESALKLSPDSQGLHERRNRVRTALAVAVSPRRQTLEEARATDFFTWFHLTAACEPQIAENGWTWHCFRSPASGMLRAVAETDVLVDSEGRIAEARLGLDRDFIRDPVLGAFARDIAKSFIRWAVPAVEASTVFPLVAAIEQSAPEGARKIQVTPSRPVPPDQSGAFEAFLGRAGSASINTATSTVVLNNFVGALPDGPVFRDGAPATDDVARQWLRIDARRIH